MDNDSNNDNDISTKRWMMIRMRTVITTIRKIIMISKIEIISRVVFITTMIIIATITKMERVRTQYSTPSQQREKESERAIKREKERESE